MLVGPLITDSRSAILDPKYAELFKRSENIQDGPSMQYKKLVHEHDFIPVKNTREGNSFIQCLTCDAYFCQSCGKSVNNNDQFNASCCMNC